MGKLFETQRSEPAQEPRQPEGLAQPFDHFKFRIQQHQGRHYFTNVTFSDPHIEPAMRQQVVDFFEGRSLETLTKEYVTAGLRDFPQLPRLLALVEEMHELLSD
ncbi:MAG: hypothetical protein L6R28_13790 [Planctomycetes bacterium]|nr:hypothetical protein [Planctomycetota bacterium]